MILRIEVHYRQSTMDIVVQPTDQHFWWRRSSPWARLVLPAPQPKTYTEGLVMAVHALAHALGSHLELQEAMESELPLDRTS